jgi:hypothetical protein
MQSLTPLGIGFLMAFGAVLRSGKSSGLNEVIARYLGVSGRRYIALVKAKIVSFANVVSVIFSGGVLIRAGLWRVVPLAGVRSG